MSSSFRKPYEILLLARKPSANVLDVPENKVIIAVPGYHSQKPCLKGTLPRDLVNLGLFDEMMPPVYRACELYARNLVEGWMSVGDECLKFMREDYWKEIPTEASSFAEA
jgi:MT-A70